MKPPMKFTLYSILYVSEEGIWEYEIYRKLKKYYNKRALSKVRSLLLELFNKSWTEEIEEELYGNSILRRYKLQERHRDFIEYQLSPHKILEELGIENINPEKGDQVNEGRVPKEY